MKVKSIIATLLLMVAGMQTTWAQKVVLYKTSGQTIECDISELDSIVFVEKEARLVTGIELSETSLTLQPDETKALTAIILPEDADNKAVTWESSDEAIATVSNEGLVTAIAEGSCTVTCSATDGSEVKAECQVTVTEAGGTAYLTCPDDHHPHAIDLGLPSGTKWCCCNVGASTPEGYGGYYAWGETSEKDYYSWETNKYYKDTGDEWGWTKYCTSTYGYNGFTDGKTELDLSDDVARVRMGAPWRMPSFGQQTELRNYCSSQWTQQNGVNGILVTGPSGGQIFLPAAGCRWYDELLNAGSNGGYWSSSLYPEDIDYDAYGMDFGSSYWYWFNYGRNNGFSVRPVRVPTTR